MDLLLSPALRGSWVLPLLPLVLLVAALLEALWLRRRGGVDWAAFGISLADVLVRRTLQTLGLSLAVPLLAWAWQHRITTVDLARPWAWLWLFFSTEFAYYAFHRASHRVRWFWATHAVHHSSNQMTLVSALRLGWTGPLSGSAVFFAPLVWLGLAPTAVAGMLALNLFYQFWLHNTWMPRWGWLEWVFNTPSHHRAHHGSQPYYLDCNYGGVLIVFDRLFGSFVAERDDMPPRYGLTVPLQTRNPWRINFHEWASLWRDLRATSTWRGRAAALWGPPPPSVQPAQQSS